MLLELLSEYTPPCYPFVSLYVFRYAILGTDLPLPWLARNALPEADGVVAVTPSRKVPCVAKWCPPTNCVTPGGCYYSEFVYAQAYDAFYTLAQALAPGINGKDGGKNYLQKSAGSREDMMTRLRQVHMFLT